MGNQVVFVVVWLVQLLSVSLVTCSYELTLRTPTPVAVLGATIQVFAELRFNGHLAPTDQFRYTWRDLAIPGHHNESVSTVPQTNWTLNYPVDLYSPGSYVIELKVERWAYVTYYTLTSSRMEIELTSMLNGQLRLTQNGTLRNDTYVSSRQPLHQIIDLLPADLAYIRQQASYMRMFWFVDCKYVGVTTDMQMVSNYTAENTKYVVQVLLYVSFDPLPEPTTTTTTTTTTTSTTTTTTTTTTTPAPTTTTSTTSTTTTAKPASTSTTTTSAPPASSAPPVHSVVRREAVASSPGTPSVSPPPPTTTKPIAGIPGFSQPVPDINAISLLMPGVDIQQLFHAPTAGRSNATQPALNRADPLSDPLGCINSSAIAMDKKHVYGLFQREIIVQNPIENLTITGANWLQYGEVLHMRAQCQGTPPYEYCVEFVQHDQPLLGNETCPQWVATDTCEFPIDHYDLSHQSYKLLVLVRNRVTSVTREVMVNVYKASKQSQLSVIVVPVACCLVAVCLVVFGVAYYMQNRTRFSVEVADFNFGDSNSVDMEYKTFGQRLYDGVRDLVRRGRPQDADTGSESSLKYGTMT